MHPTIAAELSLARHAELLSAAEQHRAARLAHPARPVRRPALSRLTAAAARSAQHLRVRAGQVLTVGSSPRHVPEPCCP